MVIATPPVLVHAYQDWWNKTGWGNEMPLNLQAVQNRNGLRTVSHARIPLVKPLGLEPAALAVGISTVATPPNAVVFGSGYLRIPDMMKAGFALNVIGIFLVTLTIYYFIPLVWGIDLTVIPESFL